MTISIAYNGKMSEIDTPFLVEVASGRVPGASVVRKYGQVTVQAGTGFRDVWEFGSDATGPYGDVDYAFPEDETAPITHFSSSDAGDTGAAVVCGLDVDGVYTEQAITLAGQTKTALTTPLWRCYRAYDASASSGAVIGEGLNGNFYVYEDGAVTNGVPDDLSTVRTFIKAGSNQTLQSFFTIPAGKVGYLVWARSALAHKGTCSAIVQAWVRPYGYNFRLADTGSVNSTGNSVFQEANSLLTMIPEKTDIIVRVDADTNDSTFTARFDILLIDKAYL